MAIFLNMLSSPEFISNLISSLIGTIIGAFLAYIIALRQFKIQKEVEIREQQISTALAYHQEMTSNDFSLARADASKVFGQNYSAKNLDEFYSDLPEDKKRSIRMVTAYFRRLQLAVAYNQIDKQMVLDLFSKEFFWWYFMWLDVMVPTHWETRNNIDSLYHWFRSALTVEKFNELKSEATNRREERLAKLAGNNRIKKRKFARKTRRG